MSIPFKPTKPVDSSKFDNVDQLMFLQGDAIVAEEKIDGCRAMLYNGQFFSRTDRPFKFEPPHLTVFFQDLRMPNLCLDGELYIPGKNFSTISGMLSAKPDVALELQEMYGKAHYYIFDILCTPDGETKEYAPYSARHELLKYFYNTFIKGRYADQYIELAVNNVERGIDKHQYLNEVWSRGGEGVVLKYSSSLYKPDRARPWIKIKKSDEADLFISGFNQSPKTGKVSSVALSGMVYDSDVDYYMPKEICSCSGFPDEVMLMFEQTPWAFLNKVVKIQYMEVTSAGKIRHPKFVGWHLDKDPRDCIWEVSGT